LNAENRSKARSAFDAGPPTAKASGDALYNLINDNKFEKLSTSDQGKALDVLRATDAGGKKYVEECLDRNVNGKSALLDKDAHGNTLLDDLHGMATQKIDPAITNGGISRGAILSSTMKEC